MLGAMIEKEIRAILLSPKFFGTFAVCSVLILLSVFVGVREYGEAVRQYDAATQLNVQRMQEQTAWAAIRTQAYRKPDAMQILSSGVHYDIGRLSPISEFESVALTQSVYSDDPIFAVFRIFDFTFIVEVVLSMFAILFTYDALSGEKEAGTLKLVFAQGVPRARFLLAKLLGAWLGLVLPLSVPVLLGLLLISAMGAPLSGGDWARIAMLLGAALLYFTFFAALGLLSSALAPRPSGSFLVSLVAWILFVLLIPKAGIMIAGHALPAPSPAEIDARIDGVARDRMEQTMKALAGKWEARNAEMEGMTEDRRKAYRDERLWKWMEEDDKDRDSSQAEIDVYARKIKEEARNRVAAQERLGLLLSRLSPAAAFKLAAMSLAGTDPWVKDRYEEAMERFRTEHLAFIRKKQEESGAHRGIQFSMSSDGGFVMKTSDDAGKLDLKELPAFAPPGRTVREVLNGTVLDLGLLGLFILAAYSAAFAAFVRYDVR